MQKGQPYTGNEPYIFFSYAHRNNDAALQIIGRLMDAGYRVWYDEGIDPGTEFAEIIAAHVKGCSYFMALMSPEYLESEYCKDELDYARNLNKPRVLVYLQDVTLPDWMQMRLSRIQAIHKYTYQDENAFYAKLFQAQGIRVCLREGYPGDGRQKVTKEKPHSAMQMKVVQEKGVLPAKQIEGKYPTELLRAPALVPALDEVQEAAQAKKLIRLMQSFNIPIEIHKAIHGPSVTRYEISVDSRVKISAIKDIENNIAMELGVFSIRMEIPIPGTQMIGVEVPRKERRVVTIREVLQSEEMQSSQGVLPVALGVATDGKPVICDLTKMPHLLMGGVAGSGKSMCMHSILLSLLYRNTPEDMQLILADATGVEMEMYWGLPHLRSIVAVDPVKTFELLQEMLEEMERRFACFQERGVRNIDGYNAQRTSLEKKMPRIVFVMDSISDLMMVCGKKAEQVICRIAQLGRVAGIHLVIGTLRTTPEVLSGMIRANIPSRIAFRCATEQDSRMLLDRSGAEKLMGYGDMLYVPAFASAPLRVQGCFVSMEDAEKVAEYWRKKEPQNELLAELTNEMRSLLSKSIDLAVEETAASTSLLQRRLGLGYARAGRLIDLMEQLGVISPADGAKPRKCLMDVHQLKALRAEGKLP